MPAITLRPYQREAVDAIYAYLRTTDRNPCCVIPTGGGKTPVMATIAHDVVEKWNGRILILAAVKELLQQTYDTLRLVDPHLPVGLYSAGLNKRDRSAPVTVAGIQSIHRKAFDFDPWNLVLIDEAHQIAPEGDGMYRNFLADCLQANPRTRLVGLTATPYRTSTGMICDPDNLLHEVCYEVGVRELIVQGYLSPLISKTALDCDTSSLHIRRGEFVADEAERLMLDVVEPACREIVRLTADRKSTLVFCQSVKHAEQVRATLERLTGEPCGFVTGETLDLERADSIRRFKSGELKRLVNCNVLTTGFDAPNVDCVALLRPTVSPGLFYQCVGRGFRRCEGKENCLVLDFGGNIKRHGPVDLVTPTKAKGKGTGAPPTKTCPQCKSEILAGYSACPDCGFEFENIRDPKHDQRAADDSILSEGPTDEVLTVDWTDYAVHRKFRAEPGDKPTLRVEYHIGLATVHKEWVCIEHTGFAGNKARAWWEERSQDPFPQSVEHAVAIANAGGLAEAKEIVVRTKPGDKFPRVFAKAVGDKPEATGIMPEAEPEREPGEDEVDDWDVPQVAAVSEEELPF